MPDKIAALILAGGRNKPEMQAACGGVENRAMVILNGRPMLEYVIDAVRDGMAAHGGGRLLVAGNVPLAPDAVAVKGGDSLADTLLNGVAALARDETRLLIAAADIPFLTGESVRDFLQKATALPNSPQFIWPIIDAAQCHKAFPGMRRTTLRVAEGTFTGGNLALLDPAFLRHNETLLRNAYARRKSVTGLAQLLGPGLLWRLAASRVFPALLPIGYAERAVGKALGNVRVRALQTDFAVIAADVDRPEDIPIAEKILSFRDN